MALQNTIANRQALPDKPVEYKCGDEIVKLTPTMIRNFLVRGNGQVTDQEISMFINLCRYQHLNPFLNEAYLIKFGSQDAQIVVGKEAITKRAMRNKRYRGQQAGVVILKDEGELEYRAGSLVLPSEQLVGGWAKVYVKDYDVPIEAAVALHEYIGLKDGKPNKQWARKPATMIRKVALMQALREAFPEDLGGMYDSSERDVEFDEENAPVPVEVPQENVQELQPEEYLDEDTQPEQGTMDTLDELFGG